MGMGDEHFRHRKMSKISVVIPSYNHRQYIQAAVESVLTQSYSDLQLIVVDDGSTDNSLDYLRTVKDPRFLLIEQTNAGAHEAINRGLQVADGDYLTILNSDDLYTRERLEKCVSALKRESAQLVTTWIEVIDAQGRPLGVKQGWKNMLPWQIPNPDQSFASSESFGLNLLISNFVSTTSNILFTRELYDSVGGMRNLRFAHDWDFMLRCAESHKCILLEEPLMQYRIHGSNTISSNRNWMLFEICWVLSTGLMRYGKTLFADGGTESWIASLHKIANSINLQGNDKVFWMIYQFINAMEAKGAVEPELLLLEDVQLRNAFIQYIAPEQSRTEGVAEHSSHTIKFADVVLYLKNRLKRLFSIS
jgi:glycosyltransferase involved in cell wall biosynthesis